jgi:TPR repeat protein
MHRIRSSSTRSPAAWGWHLAIALLPILNMVGVLPARAAADADENPEAFYSALAEGKRKHLERDFAGAIASLRRAESMRPDSAEVQLPMAVALFGVRDKTAALAALDRYAALEPDEEKREKTNSLREKIVALPDSSDGPPNYSLAIATAREVLKEIDAAAAAGDKEAVAKIGNEARKYLYDTVSTPDLKDLEVWRLVGIVAQATKDKQWAAYAFEAIPRLRKDYNTDPGLVGVMVNLNRMPIHDTVIVIPKVRTALIEKFGEAHRGGKGATKAMIAVGHGYERGSGVLQNPVAAFQAFERAATAGDVDGHWEMGRVLENGVGCEADVATAVTWYAKAATAGHQDALRRCYDIYHAGAGSVSVNPALAFKWAKLASTRDYAWGAVNAGVLIGKGWEGVAADPFQETTFYERAAQLGSAQGMFNLAINKELGLGTAADPEAALKLFRQAADLGFARAKDRADRVVKAMAAAEVANRNEVTRRKADEESAFGSEEQRRKPIDAAKIIKIRGEIPWNDLSTNKVVVAVDLKGGGSAYFYISADGLTALNNDRTPILRKQNGEWCLINGHLAKEEPARVTFPSGRTYEVTEKGLESALKNDELKSFFGLRVFLAGGGTRSGEKYTITADGKLVDGKGKTIYSPLK